MKKLHACLLVVVGLLLSATAYTQKTTKTPLFRAYPDAVNLESEMLERTLGSSTGDLVSLELSAGFTFKGKVISNTQVYNNMQTVVMQSAELDNSLMQVTKITIPDQPSIYSCRIVNEKASDGYAMKPAERGNLQLKKVATENMRPDCNQ